MSVDNAITICGSAVREPELRYTPSGSAVASFGVAVNRRWQNRQTQEWEEAVSFIDVTAWAALAEHIAESVSKGTRVIVMGRIDQRSWETPEGDRRSKIELVAEDIGISLKWGTAEFTKTERDGTTAPAGGGSAKPSYSVDEEPFAVPAHEWMPGHWGEYPERILP